MLSILIIAGIAIVAIRAIAWIVRDKPGGIGTGSPSTAHTGQQKWQCTQANQGCSQCPISDCTGSQFNTEEECLNGSPDCAGTCSTTNVTSTCHYPRSLHVDGLGGNDPGCAAGPQCRASVVGQKSGCLCSQCLADMA